jgi:hypothetical protein
MALLLNRGTEQNCTLITMDCSELSVETTTKGCLQLT